MNRDSHFRGHYSLSLRELSYSCFISDVRSASQPWQINEDLQGSKIRRRRRYKYQQNNYYGKRSTDKNQHCKLRRKDLLIWKSYMSFRAASARNSRIMCAGIA